jgi:hypothetical protein
MYLNNKALKIIEETYTNTGSKIGTYFGSNIGLVSGGILGALAGLGLSNELIQQAQDIQDPNVIEAFAQQHPTASKIALGAFTVPIGAGVGSISGEVLGGTLGAGTGALLGGALDLKRKLYNLIGLQQSQQSQQSQQKQNNSN